MDDFVCPFLWGSVQFGFSYWPSIEALGDILTMWDVTEMEIWVTRSFDNVLIIQGCFLKSGDEFFYYKYVYSL